jgi:hypothetical protein
LLQVIYTHTNYYIVSFIGWTVILILAVGEIKSYFTPILQEHMAVDKTLGQTLKIDLNISFHSLTCAQVRIELSTTFVN